MESDPKGPNQPAPKPGDGTRHTHADDSPRTAEPIDLEGPPRLEFPVVGIGASAGGLEACIEFFKQVPADSGVAYVVILHLSPDRSSMIAEILERESALQAVEIHDGMPVEPNRIHVIRPGHTLTLKEGRLHLGERTKKRGHGHPVDDFFRSLAEEQRERAVCIVLSGMGSNGTTGAQTVKATGGVCIAQEPESAKYPAMPRSLIDAGLADYVLRPGQIPEVLQGYVNHPYARDRGTKRAAPRRDRQALSEILAVLRTRTRREFSGYKTPTVLRRIERRMGLHQILELAEYAKLLRQNPSEAGALADDLVIHVTGFFRDPEAWESLKQNVIVPMVAEREANAAIRAWVTACSSGEEAYTLGMLLCEAVEATGKALDIKIFATDLAERTLLQARNGLYPAGIEGEIEQDRLERFFDKEDANYRVKRDLREMVVFAPQNVLQDPPFSRLDICTCRNLLIYLEPEMQKRVLTLLHFGLREGGALFLGSSETVSETEDLFEPIDKRRRIFRKVGPTRHATLEFPHLFSGTTPEIDRQQTSGFSPTPSRGAHRISLPHLVQRALLNGYTPPAVVIDRNHRVQFFHGDTGIFLQQPAGEPTRELIQLAKEGVRGALRIALQRASSENATITVRDGFVDTSHGRRRISVRVSPLDQHHAADYLLVTFETWAEPEIPASKSGPSEAEGDNHMLVQELQRVRDELQSTVEELQTSNEELRAANEEVTSVNEELQSTNEELETSKEELQSFAEELTTVNAQLQSKMEKLEATTNDLTSLLSSTDIGVVFLDAQFRIRRFTAAMRELLDVIDSDIGRPLSDLAFKFDDPNLLPDSKLVLEKLVPIEREVAGEEGRTYVRRVLPYRTADNRIDGVVVTFVNVTRLRAAEHAKRLTEEKYRLIVEGVRDHAILMLDQEGKIVTWSRGAEKMFGYTEAEAIGQPFSLIFSRDDVNSGETAEFFKEAAKGPQISSPRWYVRKGGHRFWGYGMLASLQGEQGKERGFVLLVRDETERKMHEEHLQELRRVAEAANESKDQFLAMVSHELRTPLSVIIMWSNMINQKILKPAQVEEGMDAIQRSAEAQKKLIEDLLDTARISSGKLRLNTRVFDLCITVKSAVDAIRPAADTKRIQVSAELDPEVGHVQADPDRMQQIMWNLLSNAVKFTDVGGRVSLTLVRTGPNVELRVTDTGKGISKEFMPQLFQRFAQAEGARNRTHTGLGLGLAITKQLTDLHGGSIEVHSDGAGQGTMFTLRFPFAKVEQQRPPALAGIQADAQVAGRLRGARILLVEDNADTRAALTAMLSEAGMVVRAMGSALDAAEAIKEERVDMILSDIGMPEVDGYEFIRGVRTAERAAGEPPVPAIALSAFTREEDAKAALESGFNAYIYKPVDAGELFGAVLAYLPKKTDV